MRKEVIIATIAGIIIGVLVAFGSWRANLALKVKNRGNLETTSVPSSKNEKKPSETPKNTDFSLTLTNVDDLDVLTDQKLTLTGITKPNSLVAISGEAEDHIVKASSNGTFEQEINLNAGPNQILLSAFSPLGENIEKKLTVVYSLEFNNITEN